MSAQSDTAAGIDIGQAPRGEIVAAQLVAAVASVGDIAERHYLELKGPPDLTSKAHKQKVAKFILGAANRLTEKALEAFEGCAVMIIGVTAKGIEGIPPIEMLELSKVVQPFLGVPGPRWDVVRVPVHGSTNQVLVVIVEPPTAGQPVFICRDNGDGLVDGRVYIRAEGETREASSAEQDAIRERANASSLPAPVDLEVSIVGKVVPISVDEASTLEVFIARTRQHLLDAVPTPTTPGPIVINAIRRAGKETGGADLQKSMSEMSAKLLSSSMFSSIPESRSREEYGAQIEEWEREVRAEWSNALRVVAGYLVPVEVSLRNLAQTFLHDVELEVHLEGNVEVVDYDELPARLEDIDLGLPLPPREWGPTARDVLGLSGIVPPSFLQGPLIGGGPSFRPSSSTWHNSGSVTINVSVGDLRPEATFITDDEQSVLVVLGESPGSVVGTWRATARGYNQVFTGEMRVEVEPTRDLTKCLRALLELDADVDEQDDEADEHE